MLSFISLALLVTSHLGDATNTARSKSKRDLGSDSRTLLQHINDEAAKQSYAKALLELPFFKTENTNICSNFNHDQVRVTLYTRSSPHGYVITDVEDSLMNSKYNVKKSTKIIVSADHHTYDNSTELVSAYLHHHHECVNVITLRYTKFFGCDFDQCVQIYDDLTTTIAELVTMLHKYGTVPDNLHMIGFGMSAHIIAGASRKLHPYKIGRVTGLDPTVGIFEEVAWLGELNTDSADFVDIILTNTAKYGTKKQHGTVHFYPNGGERQHETDDLISHLKALKYFIESIVRPGSFKSYNAHTWSDFLAGNNLQTIAYMGEHVSPRVYGNFYNKVNTMSPYSIDSIEDSSLNQFDSYHSLIELPAVARRGLMEMEKIEEALIRPSTWYTRVLKKLSMSD